MAKSVARKSSPIVPTVAEALALVPPKRPRKKRFDPARVVSLPVGRPSTFSTAIADYIVLQMMEGRDLLDICDHDKEAPARSTVYEWMDRDEEFRTRISRAREVLADHAVQRVSHVIERTTSSTANADRIKLLGLQWLAAKRNPKAYSDRYQHMEHSGQIDLAAIISSVVEPKPGDGAKQVQAQDVVLAGPDRDKPNYGK